MWVKLCDAAPMHPKLLRLSDGAFRLWINGLAFANRAVTDGRIDKALVPSLNHHGAWSPKQVSAFVAELVPGLWIDRGDHYEIHEYDHHQAEATKEQVERKRAYERERKRRQREEKYRTTLGVPSSVPPGQHAGRTPEPKRESDVPTRPDHSTPNGVLVATPPPNPLAAACDPSASRAIDAYRDGIGSVVGKRPPVNHVSRFGQASELWASLDGTDAERLDAIRRAAAVAAKDPDHRKANVPFAWFARNVGRYSGQAETPDTEAIRAKLRKLTEDEQAARMVFDHDRGDKIRAEANALRRQLAGVS